MPGRSRESKEALKEQKDAHSLSHTAPWVGEHEGSQSLFPKVETEERTPSPPPQPSAVKSPRLVRVTDFTHLHPLVMPYNSEVHGQTPS